MHDEQVACPAEAVKKPDAQVAHDVAPPVEALPATQLEHVLSTDVVQDAAMNVPDAQ